MRWTQRIATRLSRLTGIPLLGAMALVLSASGCVERVKPCEQYASFEEYFSEACPGLSWDCKALYPELPPEHQQDLDWCMDCFRVRETEDSSDLVCDLAPLSGDPCGQLLDDTLDASCFAGP